MALGHEMAYEGVVGGDLPKLTIPQMVSPGIPHVCKNDGSRENQSGGGCGPHPLDR